MILGISAEGKYSYVIIDDDAKCEHNVHGKTVRLCGMTMDIGAQHCVDSSNRFSRQRWHAVSRRLAEAGGIDHCDSIFVENGLGSSCNGVPENEKFAPRLVRLG